MCLKWMTNGGVTELLYKKIGTFSNSGYRIVSLSMNYLERDGNSENPKRARCCGRIRKIIINIIYLPT